MKSKGTVSRGFTLIELMITVAIIGILAAIAIPQFATLIRKSTEGSTKGSLGSLRSALSVYYGDMEGQYPTDLASLTVSQKYLDKMPVAKAPDYHANTSVVLEAVAPNDTGGWFYDNVPNDPNYSFIWVNCTHTDTKGSVWTAY